MGSSVPPVQHKGCSPQGVRAERHARAMYDTEEELDKDRRRVFSQVWSVVVSRASGCDCMHTTVSRSGKNVGNHTASSAALENKHDNCCSARACVSVCVCVCVCVCVQMGLITACHVGTAHPIHSAQRTYNRHGGGEEDESGNEHHGGEHS